MIRRPPIRFAPICFVFAAGLPHAAGAVSCTVSATPAVFGGYNPLGGPALDTAATVTTDCSNTISLFVNTTVALSPGGGGNYAARRLLSGTGQLAYQLYTDSARSTVWGDGSAGTSVKTDGYMLAVGVRVTRGYTVYGRIPAGQRVPAGTYTDAILVTLTY